MSKRGFLGSLFGGDTKSNSAHRATERLKVIVASENRLTNRLNPERIEMMKLEILDVVNKYFAGVKLDDVDLQHHCDENIQVLEMNINLPETH